MALVRVGAVVGGCWALRNSQWTVGSAQCAVGSGQWAVGSGQNGVPLRRWEIGLRVVRVVRSRKQGRDKCYDVSGGSRVSHIATLQGTTAPAQGAPADTSNQLGPLITP